jgi:general secretion pathway protein K
VTVIKHVQLPLSPALSLYRSRREGVIFNKKMQGMALITVLFILTLMTISAAWLSEEVLLSLRRTENVRDSQQAWQALLGSESWALSVLARDSRESKQDHPAESWNNLGQGVKIDHGKLATSIDDMQGRFNLNNLINESVVAGPSEDNKPVERVWTEAFKRLLISLELNPNLSDAVLDWLDPDQNVRGSAGAEDADYLSLKPPYRAANRAFSDVSELLQVKGFDIKMLKKLSPYISTLPFNGVRININTAPVGLLRILGKNLLSQAESEQLISGRPEEGYSVKNFLQHDMMAGEQELASPLIDSQSSYFLIRSQAEFGRARKKIHSLVERKDGVITVIRRSPVL